MSATLPVAPIGGERPAYDPTRPDLNYGPAACPRCAAPVGSDCLKLPADEAFDRGAPERARRIASRTYFRTYREARRATSAMGH